MNFCSLELSLSGSPNGIVADARFSAGEYATDIILARSAPVPLNPSALRSLLLDPSHYGLTLTTMLFAEPLLQAAWQYAAEYARACEIGLHVRLHLADNAPLLHSLRWELLHDPLSERSLATIGWIGLSRSLDTPSRRGSSLPEYGAVRAVVAVAEPAGLSRFGLSPLPAALGPRCADALAPLPVTLLGRARPASLSSIATALWQGSGVLVLLAHGSQVEGETYVWLSDEHGACERVPATAVVATIGNLPRPPTLVVLASCWSGGGGEEQEVETLGAQLVRAGVNAVVAPVGPVPMTLISAMLPKLLRDVVADGSVLPAMMQTRLTTARAEPWMIRLWCVTRNGVLWHPPAQQTEAAPRYAMCAD